MKCSKCGRENPEEATFCGFCSTALGAQAGQEVRSIEMQTAGQGRGKGAGMRPGLLAFLVIWPVLILGLGLAGNSWLSHRGAGAAQGWKDTPVDAVRHLWAVQDDVNANYMALWNSDDVKLLLTKNADVSFQKVTHMYSKRTVDSNKKLDADRWEVKATYTISPAFKDIDGKAKRGRVYILARNDGAWKIAEVRGECTLCDGKGDSQCFMCDGTGRDFNGTCGTCGGSGREKCDFCKGVGWTDLIKAPGNMGDL